MLVDDLGLTKEEVGRRVGRSRVAISNLIRLLALPEEALELIESGQLTRGPRPRDPALQGPRHPPARSARGARDGAWSVRETERRAREARRTMPPRPSGQPVVVHPDLAEALAAAEDALAAALGRDVKARATGRALRGRARLRPAPRRRSSSPSSMLALGGARRAASGRCYGSRARAAAKLAARGRLAQPVRARL